MSDPFESLDGPAIDLPDEAAWRRHCAQLLRRSSTLRDPVAIARTHSQRAELLLSFGDAAEAIEAWRAAQNAAPGHLPSLLGLRDLALQQDDPTLMGQLHERVASVLDRPSMDAADAAEIYAFFALVYSVRWPDAQRARGAYEGLCLVGGPALVEAIAPLAVSPAQRLPFLRQQLAAAGPDERPDLAARVGQLIADLPAPPEDAYALLAEGAKVSADAAWRWVEASASGLGADPEAALVQALCALADLCGTSAAATLRFLAAERTEFVLQDPAAAADLYAQANGGDLRLAMKIKGVLANLTAAVDPPSRAAALAEIADAPVLDGALLLRAAALHDRAMDTDAAWTAASEAFRLRKGDPASTELLVRLGVRGRRWRALAETLAAGPADHARGLIVSTLYEHALGDRHTARRAAGSLDNARGHLLALRMLQRLCGDGSRSLRVRASQLEADVIEAGEQRTNLYLGIARDYLAQSRYHDKALTYLFWVLDQDPEHLTALRLLQALCRSTRRDRPLMEVITRALPLLDDPVDRAALQHELGALWERAGDQTGKANALYADALDSRPEDPVALAALVRLRADVGDDPGVRAAYETALTATLPANRRAELTLALGRTLTPSDPEAAARWFADGLSVAPIGPIRDALLAEHGDHTAPAAPIPPPSLPPLRAPSVTAPMPAPDTLDILDQSIELDVLITEVAGGPTVELETADVLPLPKLSPMGARPMPPLPPPIPSADPATALNATPPPKVVPVGADTDALAFLGDELRRPAKADPGRAVVARKLRRSRGLGASDWPDHNEPSVRAAIAALQAANDLDSRFEASCTLGDAYTAHGHTIDAVRALRAALGYRAGAPRVETRLEALYRATEDYPALTDLLARRAHRSGDRARRRELLVEVARLKSGPLGDPGAAIEHYREALRDGTDHTLVRELADALRAVQRWEEYVEVLVASGLADPSTSEPEEALTIGRALLYELDQPKQSLPYILAAARTMPERVEVAADLAEARAATGEVERGERLLIDAIAASEAPDARRTLLLRLARLYEEHAQDDDRARATYRDALKAGARDPVVLERIERLAVAVHDWETLADVLERMREEARSRGADVDEQRNISIRLGHLYFRRLDIPDRAAEAFIEAYEMAPDDLSVFRVVEGILDRQPMPALQIRLYQTFLDHIRPSRARRLAMGLKLVHAFESEDRIDEAVSELEALRKLVPDDAEVTSALERVYRRGERWPALVSMYRRMLREAGHDEASRAPLLRRLGQALESGLRDLPGATEIYRELLQLDPSDVTSLRAVSRLLEAQKRWMELLEISDIELAMTKGRRQQAYIHFRKGGLLETQLGDAVQARAAYRAALALDPRCFPALHGLRDLSAADSDWPAVIENLLEELALWEEPKERAAILARIAEIYGSHLDDPQAATQRYREAVEIWPSCVPAVRALADDAFGRADYEGAAPYLQMLSNQNLDKWPRGIRADLFYKRGVAAMALGRNLEATESLKLALDFDAGHDAALHALVRAYEGRRDDPAYALVIDRLEAQRNTHADSGDRAAVAAIDQLRGDIAVQTLDLENAIEHYRRAADTLPDDLDARGPLVDLFVRQRRWEEAAAELHRFADGIRAPAVDDPALRLLYERALLREGGIWAEGAVDPARGIECFRRILRVSSRHPEALLRVAEGLYLQGDFSEARSTLKQLLATDVLHTPASRAHALFYMGRVQAVGFDAVSEAERCYRDALYADPQCASALLALLQSLGKRGQFQEQIALIEQTPLLADGARGPATGALKLFVAGLWLRRNLGDRARALLEPLAESDHPAARDARFALVDVYADAGDLEAAARPLFQTLDADICDVEALRSLAGLLDRHGDEERLLHVLSALEIYGALGAEEHARFKALNTRARSAAERGPRTIDAATFDRYLAHPSFHSPIVALLPLCERPLTTRFVARPRPVLRRTELVSGRRDAFAPSLRAIQQMLGEKDFELYLSSEQSNPCAVWPGDPPTVVVGTGAANEAQQRFLVGRAACFVRAGLTRVAALTPESALDMLALMASMFSPQLDPQHDPEAVLAELPSSEAKQADAIIRTAASSTLPAVFTGEAVLLGIGRTADRVGLLSARELRATVEAILRGEGGRGPSLAPSSDLTWAVRSDSRLRELVKYALSESYHRVRHAAGLAI